MAKTAPTFGVDQESQERARTNEAQQAEVNNESEEQ